MSLRLMRPEVPEWLEQVLGKMLARDPAQRFQTPAGVAVALEAFPILELADPGILSGDGSATVRRKRRIGSEPAIRSETCQREFRQCGWMFS